MASGVPSDLLLLCNLLHNARLDPPLPQLPTPAGEEQWDAPHR